MKDIKTANKILTDEMLKDFEAKAEVLSTEVAKIKADGEGTFKFVISTGSEDRHGENVVQDGIDVKNFMKNPVLLVDHRYTIDSIAGKFTKITRDGDKTIGEGVFADNETGAHARSLYDGGFLNAVSVGFRALAYDEEDRSSITKSELLEVSLVAVPANAEALAILDAKGIEKAGATGLLTFKQEVAQDDVQDDTDGDGDDTPADNDREETIEDVSRRLGAVEEAVAGIALDVKSIAESVAKALSTKDIEDIVDGDDDVDNDDDDNLDDVDDEDLSDAQKALKLKRDMQKGVGYFQELLASAPHFNTKTAEEDDEDDTEE